MSHIRSNSDVWNSGQKLVIHFFGRLPILGIDDQIIIIVIWIVSLLLPWLGWLPYYMHGLIIVQVIPFRVSKKGDSCRVTQSCLPTPEQWEQYFIEVSKGHIGFHTYSQYGIQICAFLVLLCEAICIDSNRPIISLDCLFLYVKETFYQENKQEHFI